MCEQPHFTSQSREFCISRSQHVGLVHITEGLNGKASTKDQRLDQNRMIQTCRSDLSQCNLKRTVVLYPMQCTIMRLTSLSQRQALPSTRTAAPSRQDEQRCNSGFASSTGCHTCGFPFRAAARMKERSASSPSPGPIHDQKKRRGLAKVKKIKSSPVY